MQYGNREPTGCTARGSYTAQQGIVVRGVRQCLVCIQRKGLTKMAVIEAAVHPMTINMNSVGLHGLPAKDPSKRYKGIAIVISLHILLIWGLISGTAP